MPHGLKQVIYHLIDNPRWQSLFSVLDRQALYNLSILHNVIGSYCVVIIGGLGDVAGSLPKALARRGHRVMVIFCIFVPNDQPRDGYGTYLIWLLSKKFVFCLGCGTSIC